LFAGIIPTRGEAARGLRGGALMVVGAMVALGCTVGGLLSGIHADMLSNWNLSSFCVVKLWLRRFAQAPLARVTCRSWFETRSLSRALLAMRIEIKTSS
jgi:hypothetical protein